jgi:hypothetical protein
MRKISAIGILRKTRTKSWALFHHEIQGKRCRTSPRNGSQKPKGELIILESKVAKGSKFVVRASIKEGKY